MPHILVLKRPHTETLKRLVTNSAKTVARHAWGRASSANRLPPSATPKKAARPAVMPMSAASRRRFPRSPNTPLATPLTAAPLSASSAASGPRLPPAQARACQYQKPEFFAIC